MGQWPSWDVPRMMYAARLFLCFVGASVPLATFGPDALRWLRSLPRRQTDADLTRHRRVIGVVGSGKTMFAVSLFLDSLRRGHTCVWVSTHGAGQLLGFLPDVPFHYIHPTKGQGINLLRQYTRSRTEKAVIASQAVTVFQRLFPSAFGQNMVLLAEAAALALLEESERTGREVTLFDLYKRLRGKDLPDTDNLIVADALTQAKDETRRAVLRRLGRPLANELLLRALSATGANALDLHALINPDAPRAIIADIDKGALGPENAVLLAHILTSQLEIVLSARQGGERMVSVFLDECQTYAHEGLAEAIEEGRKRGVCWTFCHQSGYQMTKRLGDALGLCGSQYFFALTPEDARYAARVCNDQRLPAEAFVGLPNRRVIGRELRGGRYVVRRRWTPFMRPERSLMARGEEPAPETRTPGTRTDGLIRRDGS